MECTQPGCPGKIVDGYCDYCGMPPGAAPISRQKPNSLYRPATYYAEPPKPAKAEPIKQRPPAARLGIKTGDCPQPGCRGQIVDGYCNVCGQPPIVKKMPNVLGTQLSLAASSAELGQVLIGSALAGANSTKKPLSAITNSRTRIGAGITTVPPAPPLDPEKAILSDPVVPESRRVCAACGCPVGRSTGEEKGSTFGECAKCGAHFDFRPPIKAGDLVAGQYHIVGCLAYGGMGWIYLAKDKNVSDRWVVLKGLLNVSDADAAASAKSEGEFLAQVEHPMIVEIYNFVEHEGARYIVMEYVPGRSITQLLKARRAANGGQLDPLPIDWGLAYLIEIAPAFSYLHSRGLLYCDFKPDNLIQVGDSLKLIDLGSVRRIDDDSSAIFGTVGYQAPEVGDDGCSVASDIYTLGRSLLVMCADFSGFQTEYVSTLPPAHKLSQFDRNESCYRLVARACAPRPEDRFQSAEAFQLQALGVLREVAGRAFGGAALTSATSTLFTTPSLIAEEDVDWQSLPQLRADLHDPMREWLTTLAPHDPRARMSALKDAEKRTGAVILAQIEIALQLNDPKLVSQLIAELQRLDPWDWRAAWMQGVAEVSAKRWYNAIAPFNTVYAQLPGELAPKFALALACERAEQPQIAEQLFAICAATDASYVPASAFALARLRAARGDEEGTLNALAMVPPTSRGYGQARRTRAKMLLAKGDSIKDLAAAFDSVEVSGLGPLDTAKFKVSILEKALAYVERNGPQPLIRIGGQPAIQRNIRPQLEQAYRTLALWTPDTNQRNQLLTKADQRRRWSLF